MGAGPPFVWSSCLRNLVTSPIPHFPRTYISEVRRAWNNWHAPPLPRPLTPAGGAPPLAPLAPAGGGGAPPLASAAGAPPPAPASPEVSLNLMPDLAIVRAYPSTSLAST